MTEAVKSATALGISLSVNLSSSHALVMQTHVEADCALTDLNALVDKLTRVCDRQAAKYKLDDMRKNLKLHETTMARAVGDLNDLDARFRAEHTARKHHGEFKLNDRQTADRSNTVKSIERFKEEIAKIKLEIEAAEKEAT